MGNPNAKGTIGNKGGYRKSAYEEHKDAEWTGQLWRGEHDVEVLEKKVLSKKYSGKDIATLKILKGNERLIAKVMDKLIPDLHDHTSGGERIFCLPSELIQKNDINSDVDPS